MAYRMGIDVGGTFTDLIVADDKGQVRMFKAPSTPADLTQGVFNALKLAAEDYGVPLQRLLGDCEQIVHGTTIATNAVIQRTVAKTGLICTNGHQSVLYLRDGVHSDTYNLKLHYFEPYVPMYLTLPVKERIDAEGGIVIPLNKEDIRQAIRQFKKWDVEAIAVSLLWSIRNSAHEQMVAEIIEQEWPGIPYSISSDVQPIIREWPRTCATVLDASLKPVMGKYTDSLQQALTQKGFKREFLMVVASGGVVAAKDAARKPVYTVLSGPAIGPVAGLLFGQELGTVNCIVTDMGGTSFDVSVTTEGRIATSRAARVAGIPIGISSVEVNTLGAGGGSIAWVDAAGLLHVGPHSAGAVPGPACYNAGGTEATVTDANLVLGYINPDYFLGGRIKIAPKLSRKVIEEKIAKPLKIGVAEAAYGIFKVVNQNMVSGIAEISVRRGLDPREYVLIGGGGAGPAHIGKMAQELGMRQVIIPRMAAALCAVGMLAVDIKFDNVGSYYTTSDALEFEGVNRVLSELERRGRTSLEQEGIPPANRRFNYFVHARYPNQAYELEVPLRNSQVARDDLSQLVQDFHDIHERTYAVCERGNYIECIDWRVVATGIMPKVSFPRQSGLRADASGALKGKRQAYFEELGGFVETPIYEGSKLACGNIIKSPAIIEEPATTLVIFPGSQVTVTEWGDYLMELT